MGGARAPGVGVRTVFNIWVPAEPAGAKRMMLGVYSPDLLELYGNTVHAWARSTR